MPLTNENLNQIPISRCSHSMYLSHTCQINCFHNAGKEFLKVVPVNLERHLRMVIMSTDSKSPKSQKQFPPSILGSLIVQFTKRSILSHTSSLFFSCLDYSDPVGQFECYIVRICHWGEGGVGWHLAMILFSCLRGFWAWIRWFFSSSNLVFLLGE